MQPGDVPVTYADTTPPEQDFGFKPNTSLREGLRRFAEWYAKYYDTEKEINKEYYEHFCRKNFNDYRRNGFLR